MISPGSAGAVIPLSAIRDRDRGQVGGKASELGRLARAGLPVPAGVVVPVEAFQRALHDAGLWELAASVQRDRAGAPVLRDAIANLRLPDAAAAEWVRASRALGQRVAVRSSGVDEDGAQRSYAGQHTTMLQVRPEDVPSAIVRCWSSLYADRALSYRGATGPAPGSLAVVLQEMVEPLTSGVLFTVNPLNGSWREMVVEAVWGLGEGLVGGQIAPHWYVMRRPRPLPRLFRRVAERVRLQVVEEDLPELTSRFVGAPGGSVVREPTPAALRHKRTLERPVLRRLGRLGLKVERALGGPQDIEWVRDRAGAFRVLQARPITATGAPRGSDEVVWTRRFIGERWPEPATPLGWSILEPILSWYIAYPQVQRRHLGGGPALKLVHGRPYVNATVFRHLAFKLPGAPAPQFMLEMIPPEEASEWHRRFAVPPDLAVYASILRHTVAERRWRRFRWNPLTNPAEWEAFRARLESALPALRSPCADPEALIARVEEQERWVREYVGIHVCSLLFANIAWQLLQSAIAGWLPDQRSLMDSLGTSPPGNLTVETNQALYELGQRAEGEDLDALERGCPVSQSFQRALTDFLARFGHRAQSTWELMSPRWHREPAQLAPLLKAVQGPGASPEARARAQEDRFERALQEVEHQLSGPRRAVLERLVADTREYLLLRENQRFWFDHLLDAMQGTMLALGAHGTHQGWLLRPSDVAMLRWDELRTVVRTGGDPDALTALIARRQAVREADARVDPPTFLVGDGTEPREPDGATRLQGLGISPGRVRGRVRVLRSAAEGDRLEPGDVLVTRAVDPSWTPLFLTAGAVVLELGSVLSHGAVIAREYRIPAVVNIEGATRRLVEGTEVTVDGHRGVVWVHPAEG